MDVKIGLSGNVKTNGRGSAETRNGILQLPCFWFLCQAKTEKLEHTLLGQFNCNNPCTWMMEEVPVSETPCVSAKNKTENAQRMYIQNAPSVPYTATHCGNAPFIKGA